MSERGIRLAQLSGWVALIALVWLVVLPSLSQRESTRAYLEQLKRRGIDPSAMYYTELPPDLFLDFRDEESIDTSMKPLAITRSRSTIED